MTSIRGPIADLVWGNVRLVQDQRSVGLRSIVCRRDGFEVFSVRPGAEPFPRSVLAEPTALLLACNAALHVYERSGCEIVRTDGEITTAILRMSGSR